MINWFCLICFSLIHPILGISRDLPQGCPTIISKSQWLARPAKTVEYVIIPVKYVIIHHTANNECDTEQDCLKAIREIQNSHIDFMEFHDIGYNFIIGGDGNVYEGDGWHKVGAHTRGYNYKSLGISFVGNFADKLPSTKMLNALRDLMACGVDLGELHMNYKLFAARQVSGTASPGHRLYTELQNWLHFASTP